MKKFYFAYVVIFVLLILLIIPCCAHHQNKIYRFYPETSEDIYLLNYTDSNKIGTDTMNYSPLLMSKIQQMDILMKKGVLMTPQEYTNNIVSYYNTIIVVLISIIAALTILGAVQIKLLVSRLLDDELDSKLNDQLKKMLSNSDYVEENIIKNIKGSIDDSVLETITSFRLEQESLLSSKFEEINNKIASLEERNEEQEESMETVVSNITE